MGVGSAASRKILMRVQGPSPDPADDVLLEGKVVRELDDDCLEASTSRPTLRVLTGNQQLGRLKHNILVAGPELAIRDAPRGDEELRDWWIRSWEPSYREIGLDDLRAVGDLSDIVFDSAVQLATGSIHNRTGGAPDDALRTRLLASVTALEPRLRKAAGDLVLELLQGWRELAAR
jgi:hypothetical protein